MQAVIIAAGKSSRFYPFDENHKSLFKILGKPLISHTTSKIAEAGIRDLIIVVGNNSKIPDVLGDGKDFNTNIKYLVQKEPMGAADALLLAKNYIKDDFFLIHPHRVDFLEYASSLLEKKKKSNIVLLAEESGEARKFGFVDVKGDRVHGIVEKPKALKKEKLRVVGIYLFNKAFLEVLKNIKGENVLEDAITVSAKKFTVSFIKSRINPPTLKYPWDLFDIKDYLFSSLKTNISKNAKVSEKAKITGEVVIEDGAEISENAIIRGPVFVGKNSFIGTGSLLRNDCDIEGNVKIGAFMEIKNSIIGTNSTTHSGYIGDSLIGENTKIGSSFDTQNVRLDRASVKVVVGNEKIDSGRKYLGAIIGNNVIVGGRVSVMPGIVVGSNTTIGPGTTVMKNIEENSLYYTKFKEIISKKQ